MNKIYDNGHCLQFLNDLNIFFENYLYSHYLFMNVFKCQIEVNSIFLNTYNLNI